MVRPLSGSISYEKRAGASTYSREESHAVFSPSRARWRSINSRSSASTVRSRAARPSKVAGVSAAAGNGVSARRSEESIGFHSSGSSNWREVTASDSSGCTLA
eukprot:scaffold111475_cov27-Tisochrysis_lutea.AAC.3